MEIYEEISYDTINSYGEWITVTRYELIEWNETETETETEKK